MEVIRKRLEKINYEIDDLCAKYGVKRPEILGASKYVNIDVVKTAFDCGLATVGENYIQHYLEKKDFYPERMNVDIIGHLQSNKINYVVNQHVRYIQSVDSIKLAELINKRANQLGFIQNILLEVNIAEEISKSGISANDLEPTLEQIALLENVKTKGLMFMEPFGKSEYYLPKSQELFEKVKEKYGLQIISAGLSDSWQVALKHGSNILRLGTAIFGERVF